MTGYSRGAFTVAATAAVLALAACGGGPRGFYESGPPRVPAGGSFTVEPGQEVVVYGVRARRCGMEPPSYETAAGEMFSGEGAQAPQAGEVFDAGLGQRASVPCGGSVPVRAIGYRAPADFEGEVTMVFYGVDQATVAVAFPPEPEPEPEPEATPESPAEGEPSSGDEAAPQGTS